MSKRPAGATCSSWRPPPPALACAPPPLSGTLLAGITRDSILRLADSLGYAISEEPLTLDAWEQGCRAGRITETFACGTARSIVPVGHVVSTRQDWAVGDGVAGPVTSRLRQAMLDIHHGSAPDLHGGCDS